jgi:hypothetical protein
MEGLLTGQEFGVLLISALYKIVLGLIAMCLGFGCMLGMLKMLGISIREWGVNAEKQDLGVFFGLLSIGVCLLYGLILS